MLTAFDSIPARDRVIVALDCDAWEAIALADKLEGHAKWLKIGMTLYYAEGPAIVKMFKRRGFNVFLDLKFHDIPHQVQGGVLRTAAEQTEQAALVQLQQHPAGKAPCGKAGVALHGVIALRMGHNGPRCAMASSVRSSTEPGSPKSNSTSRYREPPSVMSSCCSMSVRMFEGSANTSAPEYSRSGMFSCVSSSRRSFSCLR